MESGTALLLDAERGQFISNIGLDRLGGCDVGIAASAIALLELSKAATVPRRCQLWIEFQRGIIVRYGVVELPEFQVGEAAGVEIVGVGGLKLKRPVAITGARANRTFAFAIRTATGWTSNPITEFITCSTSRLPSNRLRKNEPTK